MTGLRSESNAAIHKAAGRGQPVTQDISLSVKGDKVVCSINGSIVTNYDKDTLVGHRGLRCRRRKGQGPGKFLFVVYLNDTDILLGTLSGA